jgi:Uma2 family endonuclease
MAGVTLLIGPADQGRRLRLEEFAGADCQPGYLYELARGVLVVSDVPNRRHLAQVTALRRQLSAYDLANAGRIHTLAAGSECKIVLTALESERHPDLAIYKTPPPDDEPWWALWVPEIVVEVVSPGSAQRDYTEKREEYLLFGVLEYWIIDADRQELLVLRRAGGQWRERVVRPPEVYRTRLLPGLELAPGPVFEAAHAVPG